MVTQDPHVAIIGAGFGGLSAARALRKTPVRVTLIDRENYHLFQPLLYQVATAGLEPGDIAHSVREVFHGQSNAVFEMDQVVRVDLDRRLVLLATKRSLEYDYLILATGATTNTFGIPGVQEHGFPLKTLGDADSLRNHVLSCFERVDRDPTLIEKGALTFVVVGGGPTGVEVAGALNELFKLVLRKDYPRIDMTRARVVLVEMADRLLGSYATSLQKYAAKALEKRHIDVRLNTSVVRVEPGGVTFGGGERLQTETLIWAAGIAANVPEGLDDIEKSRGGRLIVDGHLRCGTDTNVFAIGDVAAMTDEEGNLLPQVATPAIQAAKHVAGTIRGVIRGKATKPFRYRDLGQMATIGRHSGVVQLPSGVKLKGWSAWVGWLILHLLKIIGFKNRLSILLSWVWNYVTYDRSARLIFWREKL